MFRPGKIVKIFKSKKGNEVILRLPKWEDLNQCLKFINKLSQEDTFISVSGERIKKEEEMEWLVEVIKAMEKKEALHLFAFVGKKLIGNCSLAKGKCRRRDKHVGQVAIAVDKEFRDEGIGTEMLEILIEKSRSYGIKTLQLSAFANNLWAIHTYQKLGFKECGRIPKGIFYKGQYIDEIILFRKVESENF